MEERNLSADSWRMKLKDLEKELQKLDVNPKEIKEILAYEIKDN